MSAIKKILIGKESSCQAIWFMRQAGRYLPEFRKIRLQNKNFIELCFNSKLSSEITLQPIKRYNLDSAIIFSDILLVPYALGQDVSFIKNKGPILNNFDNDKFLENNEKKYEEKLKPIYRAIKETRKKLQTNKSLISFVGAPWTLVVYMFGLKENKNKINIPKFEKHKKEIYKILKDLIKYLCIHIKNQIDAGADLVQVFDSWAGLLPEKDLENFCYNPNLEITNFCKEKKIPIICFPKGIGRNYLKFQNIVQPDGLNLDYEIDLFWAQKNLNKVTLQGGMDPQFLLKSDEEMFNEAKKYLDVFKDVPYIFNLGHGIVPETNPDKLEKLIKFVRNYE
jgi:uroporphyrinogen decarboxylase|tara:strand:- start:5644 stop:6654 length:1011 start_codon:yes stop_codon:yes gene_type:complete